ncbi:BspA family leucine-rich repeat surface protein [Chryseobacterium ginsenosidimutans]|uniref:BspA family leucine-rich repeat surface protein n=1 Tax=Chryseobacterium ginsenosidimutans TaxID=687846 RepID=UPI0027B99CA8|nr:BspA family leucine-rich repeat surface protein [Chryseobacterium ginsenosidimutans]
MLKKLLTLFIFISLIQITYAQNEFITIWKPGTAQQIKFPGRGTNFNVSWEEVGYPIHNGTINNITSNKEFIVNFGTPSNPISANATYRIKVSNGSGSFNQVRFYDSTLSPIYSCTDMYKIIDIAQWGNIQWATFDNAFVLCADMNVSATDVPNLSSVTTTKEMFFLCGSLTGNASFNNWNTSTITNMYNMFGEAINFNAPVGNWNVSNVTNMSYLFDYTSFNQPLNNWDTSNATQMEHMFHGSTLFNQDIRNWNTSKVTDMTEMFHETSFNQNLGQWNLNSLTTAQNMFLDSGMSCENYDNTLYGWSLSSAAPSNINLSSASPLVYSHPQAVNARNFLITSKGWIISGDSYNAECNSILSASEDSLKNETSIYPNPATDFIYVKNLKGSNRYKILDQSGRIILQNILNEEKIDISYLVKGNYILQIIAKDKTQSFKLIKN